ncbi:MAG: hypothetical protein QXG33_02120, partial [Candidatus Anstonellales archaeon]
NRAIQSKRQVGSAFKPIIYATAVTAGYTPASVIEDMPVSYEMPVEEKEAEETPVKWKPLNYDVTFKGDITLSEALAEEIEYASKGDATNSYAIKKRDETERIARSSR